MPKEKYKTIETPNKGVKVLICLKAQHGFKNYVCTFNQGLYTCITGQRRFSHNFILGWRYPTTISDRRKCRAILKGDMIISQFKETLHLPPNEVRIFNQIFT